MRLDFQNFQKNTLVIKRFFHSFIFFTYVSVSKKCYSVIHHNKIDYDLVLKFSFQTEEV